MTLNELGTRAVGESSGCTGDTSVKTSPARKHETTQYNTAEPESTETKHGSVRVPTGYPSRGMDVTVYVCDINQPSLPIPIYSVLVSISVFMALSTVFHSINSPDNSPFSHFVLPVLSLSY